MMFSPGCGCCGGSPCCIGDHPSEVEVAISGFGPPGTLCGEEHCNSINGVYALPSFESIEVEPGAWQCVWKDTFVRSPQCDDEYQSTYNLEVIVILQISAADPENDNITVRLNINGAPPTYDFYLQDLDLCGFPRRCSDWNNENIPFLSGSAGWCDMSSLAAALSASS